MIKRNREDFRERRKYGDGSARGITQPVRKSSKKAKKVT